MACTGDEPVGATDSGAQAPDASSTSTVPVTDGATPGSDAAKADASDPEAGDAGPACSPPKLGATNTEDITAGIASNVELSDFTFDCTSYFLVTSTGAILRRDFTETTWQTIVQPTTKASWNIQVDDLGLAIVPTVTASFSGPPGSAQTPIEAFRYDRNGGTKTVLFSEAAPATLTSVAFAGPYQRTANTIAFLGTASNRTVTVTGKRAPAQPTVSGGLGFLGKSLAFDTGSIAATPLMLAWARPENPGAPAQVVIEGNPRTSTLQTLNDSPRATKAVFAGFRAITEDYALFRATNAQSVPVLSACSLQANGVCALLDAAPYKSVLDYTVTDRSPIASDGKTFAVTVLGPNGNGSAVSLCETASFARDNNCSSAKMLGQSAGPSATRIALSRADLFVEYPNGTTSKWVRYPRP